MKYLNIAALLLFMPLLAHAGQKVDKTLEFVSDGYVDIANVNGQVKVIPWNNNSVKVSGELGDDTRKFTFERNGNRIKIKVEAKDDVHDLGDNLVINLPGTSKVSYAGINSRFTTAGITGDLAASTVNGSLTVDNCQGRIKINTVNGKITSNQLTGILEFSSVNGAITVNSAGGEQNTLSTVNGMLYVNSSSQDVKIHTVSGDIAAEIGNIKHLEVSGVSGDATIHLNLLKDGNVDATSVSGNLDLNFMNVPSAHFSIESPTGGNIINHLSNDKATGNQYGPGRHLQFTTLGGDGKVSVTTVSGTITLEKK